MTNNESIVFQGLSEVIRNNILAPISQYLRTTKNIEVSVDELSTILKLPAQSRAPMSMIPGGVPPISSAPSALASLPGLGMPMTTSRRGKSSGGSTQSVPESEQCMYKFTRGKAKGERCASRRDSGSQWFCSTCKKKKSAQTQITNGTSSFSGSSQTTGFNPMNPLMGAQMMAPRPSPSVKVSPLSDGYYREHQFNLLLMAGNSPHEFVCKGIIDKATNKVMPLTGEAIQYCQEKNISYVDPTRNMDQGSGVQRTTPTVPQLPGVSVPQLPSVYAPQGSTSVSVPQLPSVYAPQMSSVSVPQLPSVNAPQMSSVSVPQMSSVSVPQVSTSMSVPQVTSVHAPQVSTSTSVPQVSSMSVPQLPSINAPQIHTSTNVPQLPSVQDSPPTSQQIGDSNTPGVTSPAPVMPTPSE